MPQRKRLWIVITDGEHARIVVPGPAAGAFHTERAEDSATAHKRSTELGSDAPGRAFESSGSTRHAIAPKHDPHEMAKQRFLQSVAAQINQADAEGAFDELVLAAPAGEIAELRDALDRGAAAKVIGTLGKDLVKVPDHELGPHLAQWARPAAPKPG